MSMTQNTILVVKKNQTLLGLKRHYWNSVTRTEVAAAKLCGTNVTWHEEQQNQPGTIKLGAEDQKHFSNFCHFFPTKRRNFWLWAAAAKRFDFKEPWFNVKRGLLWSKRTPVQYQLFPNVFSPWVQGCRKQLRTCRSKNCLVSANKGKKDSCLGR